MEKIIELLKKHDRYYLYSDDMRVYTNGQKQWEEILKLLFDQGMTKTEAFNFITKFYKEN